MSLIWEGRLRGEPLSSFSLQPAFPCYRSSHLGCWQSDSPTCQPNSESGKTGSESEQPVACTLQLRTASQSKYWPCENSLWENALMKLVKLERCMRTRSGGSAGWWRTERWDAHFPGSAKTVLSSLLLPISKFHVKKGGVLGKNQVGVVIVRIVLCNREQWASAVQKWVVRILNFST